MLFLVSIEPMYSQGVGDYEYLCDSMEKVERFRLLMRDFAESIQHTPGLMEDIEDEEYSGWEFFERVYLLDSTEPVMDGLIQGRLIYTAEYADFSWLQIPQ